MLLGNWIFIIMTKKTQKNTIITKIAVATMIAIFSLGSAFAGTIAWFSSSARTTVTGGSFKVQTPTGIGCSLYQLHHFLDGSQATKPGNFVTNFGYIGYENPSITAVFQAVSYNEQGEVTEDPNPTVIENLWPAHRLTYALLIEGDTSSSFTFTLNSWSESVREGYQRTNSRIDNPDYGEEGEPEYLSSPTSITWATNIYCRAYLVGSTQNSVLTDIATGYNTFKTTNINANDKFNASQSNPLSSAIEMANSEDDVYDLGGSRLIIYFSIEFSNYSDTFYSLGNDGYYYKDALYGNSNCYRGLTLTNLVFNLV